MSKMSDHYYEILCEVERSLEQGIDPKEIAKNLTIPFYIVEDVMSSFQSA